MDFLAEHKKKLFVLGIVVFVLGLIGTIYSSASRRDVAEEPMASVEGDTMGQNPESVDEPAYTITPIPIEALITTYQGRDPAEVRPVPDEVKLFSEEQKTVLFAAIREAGEAVKKNPDDFESWLLVGVRKKIIGDFEGARDAWVYAGVIRPLNDVSFANLGELYWRYIPDFPKSEENFKRAFQNNPANTQARISLAELYFYSYAEKKGLFDDVLLEGLAAIPGDLNLMKALAYLYERNLEYQKAVEWWTRVLEKDPGNTEVERRINQLRAKL